MKKEQHDHDIDQQLHQAVNEGDAWRRDAVVFDKDLIKVLGVPAAQTGYRCHEDVDAVDEKEKYAHETTRITDKLKKQEDLDEGQGITSDVAGEATGVLAEIKKEKHD